MAGKIKSITNPRLSLEIITPDDVRQIHTSTLNIIEDVGVKFPSRLALDIWEANGASVDRNTSVVKVPGHMIEEALKNAPPVYTLAVRNSAQDLLLDGNHVYLGTDGCGVESIDIHTGQLRRSCLKDVEDIAQVADYLDQVAFQWVPVSAQDYPPQSRSLHELLAIWQNSSKHVQTESIYSGSEAREAVKMAAAIAGGKEALRKRPLLSFTECTLSPLSQDGGSLIWSFEQMIMDCEIFDIIHKMMKGIVVDNETLTIDIIREVGPGGHFLSQKHTRINMRDLWLSTLMDRRPYNEWLKTKDDARDWARKKAKNILLTHSPQPLDASLKTELKRIIQSYENIV